MIHKLARITLWKNSTDDSSNRNFRREKSRRQAGIRTGIRKMRLIPQMQVIRIRTQAAMDQMPVMVRSKAKMMQTARKLEARPVILAQAHRTGIRLPTLIRKPEAQMAARIRREPVPEAAQA